MDQNQIPDDSAAEDAAFAAGFASVAGGEQPPAAHSEPGPADAQADDADASHDDATAHDADTDTTAAPAADKAADAPADELAGLPESVRAKLASFDQVMARLRNVEGHVGGINSQLKQIASKPVPQAPAASDTPAPQGMTGEKWKRLQEDFPEVADALAEQLQQVRQPGAQPGVSLQDVETRIEQARREVQYELIEERHPSWQSALQSPDGQAWLQTLSPSEQSDFLNTERANVVNSYLDRFKAHREQVSAAMQTRQSRERIARDAVAPTGGAKAGGARRNEPTEDDAFLAGFRQVRGG